MTEPKSRLVGIVSPPYENIEIGKGLNTKPSRAGRNDQCGRSASAASQLVTKYSVDPSNIGNLPDTSSVQGELDIEGFCGCGELYWFGCYENDARYKRFVTAESFAHPAKMSWALLKRVYDHLEVLGLLKPDDTVIDFMAGSGRTSVIAGLRGYRSVNVELEPHFVKMIRDNKVQTEKTLKRGVNTEVLQGDARNLSTLLTEKGYVGIISPPYGEAIRGGKSGIEWQPEWGKASESRQPSQTIEYSSDPANIGNLPDKPSLVGITSPPYADIINASRHIGSGTHNYVPRPYSEDPNNIGNLKDKPSLVGITSPPYSSQNDHQRKIDNTLTPSRAGICKPYNLDNPNNIGNLQDKEVETQPQSYLSAMSKVYGEAFKSGVSPLVVVVKNPTRKHVLRRLDLDTAKLLLSCGYKIIDYHRAVLFRMHEQATLDGQKFTNYKGRLSFFKRLSLEKGNVAAQWEDILIAAIPNTHGLAGITSPPYTREEHTRIHKQSFFQRKSSWSCEPYSSNPANIGNLPDTRAKESV